MIREADDVKTTSANPDRRSILMTGASLLTLAATNASTARAEDAKPSTTSPSSAAKPNILMIMADDIGWFNVSAYNMGIMGYRTPNIDRIGKEGAVFTDWYGEQSCTAGRAAFITGQSPIRTGLTKVGLPGATVGLHAEDMSVAEALKPLGYATGQFGKNHLGDRNEFLPTAHGFDEFFGNLYHLNAEEEPENPDYPKDPRFRAKFGPRGVLKCKASAKDDPTDDPSYGRVGKQVIENTGPLDTKRMETVDEEFLTAALDFIDRNHKAGMPWFCYFNSTRMHIWTHLKAASQGKTGFGIYPDGMVELDGYIGQLLKKLDDLGIADNTLVIFTTDNGAEVMSWPDGGSTPFRGEKATNWEGGYRVPMLIRWPGTIQPGTVYNEMFSHYDLIPTFAAAGGNPDIVAQCLKGAQIGDKTFKVHLDGYNLIPFFKGEAKDPPRKEFIYWNDDGQLVAIRFKEWKCVFLEQNHKGLGVWQGQFTDLRVPKLFNVRSDPFERGDESIEYDKWLAEHVFVQVPMQGLAAQWLTSFSEFPVRQKPASFNLDNVMASMEAASRGSN
ncbi:MAG: arylsulfatase [Hyphomicrobium sp.]|uniref:arylsulfatase n=1 Tax=Hyphomicrobium sp. TaxID=82 RepID=UPI0039E29653